MDNGNAFDLMGFFLRNFSVEIIYTAGWYAALEWTLLVSGFILAIGSIVRIVQSQFTQKWRETVISLTLYTVLTTGYFLIIWMVIELFNAIYGLLSVSDTMGRLGSSLNSIIELWNKSKFEFSLRDLANSFFGAFGFVTFIITFMLLTFVIFGLRIAHAILVSLAAFWGAVAIPMSVVNGLKSLSSLKTIVLVAFVWPIFDAFLMFLVGAVMLSGLENSISAANTESITASQLVFALIVYSVINLFLIAAAIAAPLLAQGVANGTGNVTGLLASFGGAGLAAGVMASKFAGQQLKDRGAALKPSSLLNSVVGGGGSGSSRGSMPTPRVDFSRSQSEFMKSNDGAMPAPSAAAGGAVGGSSVSSSASSADQTINSQASSSGKNSPSELPKASSNSSGSVKSTPSAKSNLADKATAVANRSDNMDTNITNEQAAQAEQGTQEEGGISEEATREKQARRGAIINNQRKGKN